jgi:hypothetical protein
MTNEQIEKRLADVLIRCGIKRGVLGQIDADNVARILLPVVREMIDERAAGVWALASRWVGPPFAQEFLDRADDLRRGMS